MVYYLNLKSNHEYFTGIHTFLGLFLCLFGLSIRCMTIGYAAENTSGRNTKAQMANSINTTGLYSVVRHPLYVGNFFMWLGVAMLVMSISFAVIFILFFFLYYERIILAEEDYIKNKFGNVFDDWARRTPLIIPALKQWKSSNRKFSWKKILKQEKTGFMALFLVIFIFECVFNIHRGGRIVNFNSLWFILMLSSVVIYSVLKFLKYNTDILSDSYH